MVRSVLLHHWVPSKSESLVRVVRVFTEPMRLRPMPSPERPATPVSLFYSYSHKDEALRDELETHLTLLRRQGVVRGWYDRRIPAGTEWAGQIDQHLEAADVILLLVSADFLASDYCYDKEMKRALERHGAGAARVIPVILRPCDWQSAPFWKLQALPKDGKPVTTWKDRDEAFTDIARGIRGAAASLTAGALDQSAAAPPTEVVTPSPTARPRAVDRAARCERPTAYPALNMFMLGPQESGKSVFIASMYKRMSVGVGEFRLTSTDFEQQLKLDAFWTGLADGRCPDETLEGYDLEFIYTYAFDPVMTVSWYDYPGGWLAPRTGEDRSNYDVLLSRLASADFVMCCIPIDQLLESYKSGAACPLSNSTTSSSTITARSGSRTATPPSCT